jgi:DNA polymerase III delta prime subunit
VLPAHIKKEFAGIVASGEMLDLLLTGPSGTGKTTVAKAMCQEMGLDYKVINGSLQNGIDTLRNDIMTYASTISVFGNSRKVVILDEADYLNPNSFQPALRNFMEEFSVNCGFILTCNFSNRIIDPLKSRCATIDFVFPADEKAELLKGAVRRVRDILVAENVEFDIKAVAGLISKNFPDLRKSINQLQKYAKTGPIDAGILSQKSSAADVIKILKSQKFTDMRTWVAENADLDFSLFIQDLYNQIPAAIQPEKIPYLILILSKYDYQNAFVSNREINTAAMLTEIMADCFV